MDDRKLGYVLDILGYLATAYACRLADEVQRIGHPDDVTALDACRNDIAACARALRSDYPKVADALLEQIAEDLAEDALSHVIASNRRPP